MKPKNADINLLLACLLIFSLTIKAAYRNKSQETSAQTNCPINQYFVSLEDGLALVHPLVMSISIEKIIELLKQFPPDISYNISKQTVGKKESPLSKQDKEQLIFGLAHEFKEKPTVQKNLFALLFELDKKVEPIQLLHVARCEYNPIIPIFIQWATEQQKEHPELEDIALKSLYSAIDENDAKALKVLIESGISISKKQSSDLLWHAIKNNKNSGFVPFLAEQGANLSVSKEGHTLVTKATEQNNKTIVESLIAVLEKQGTPKNKIAAYINRVADPQVGSALQIAFQNGYTDLELYLREQGGREK